MSVTIRRFLLSILGLLAGLAAWPITELALAYQEIFPSYFVFSITLGTIFGLIMGGFFGSGQGIGTADREKFKAGMITGAVVGVIGGVVGFLIGQGALFIVGEIFVSNKSFNTVGFPIARSVGWGFLGLFIGSIEGIRTQSPRLVGVGLTGGLLGGILGGLAVEYLNLVLTSMIFTRLIGLLILGLLIGFFYGLVEHRLSFGVLKVLNGKYKGKEYLINRRRTRIGSGKKADILLEPYEKVDDLHAELRIKGDEVIVRSLASDTPVTVNDDRISEQQLKYDDVIRIGTAKFIYL